MMNRTASVSGRLVCGIATLATCLLVGCASDVADDEFDDEKATTSLSAIDVAMSSEELDELDCSDPAETASRLAASKTKGCRTRAIDPSNPKMVHVTLQDCDGRFDRHVVSGQLTVTFSAKPDGSLHSESVSNDLTIDGRPFSRSVSADITCAGDVRTVTRRAEKTGTKKNGVSLVRTSDSVVVTDRATRCRTENGTGHAVIGGTRTIESKITNFETCETPERDDYCPKGTIEDVNESKGKTVLKTFDGSSSARIEVSRPKGDKVSIWTLSCTPR